MSVKEKIKKEIDDLPNAELKYVHRFLCILHKRRKPFKTEQHTEEEEWQKFAMQEFLKGYAESDAIYDKL